jgi:hypothetical protein
VRFESNARAIAVDAPVKNTHCTRPNDYFWIAECFEISPFNRCFAPNGQDPPARFVALSTPSDKLDSEARDGWIQALVSCARAAFEFLAFAVRSSPNVARHAAKSFFDLADDQIASTI